MSGSSNACRQRRTTEDRGVISEPQVLVGTCGLLFSMPEKDLPGYYAGFGVVALIAVCIAVIGATACAFAFLNFP